MHTLKRCMAAMVALLALSLAMTARAELPDFTPLVEQASPAVVNISTRQKLPDRAMARGQLSIPDLEGLPPMFRDFLERSIPQVPRNPRGQQREAVLHLVRLLEVRGVVGVGEHPGGQQKVAGAERRGVELKELPGGRPGKQGRSVARQWEKCEHGRVDQRRHRGARARSEVVEGPRAEATVRGGGEVAGRRPLGDRRHRRDRRLSRPRGVRCANGDRGLAGVGRGTRVDCRTLENR